MHGQQNIKKNAQNSSIDILYDNEFSYVFRSTRYHYQELSIKYY